MADKMDQMMNEFAVNVAYPTLQRLDAVFSDHKASKPVDYAKASKDIPGEIPADLYAAMGQIDKASLKPDAIEFIGKYLSTKIPEIKLFGEAAEDLVGRLKDVKDKEGEIKWYASNGQVAANMLSILKNSLSEGKKENPLKKGIDDIFKI